MNVAFLLSHVRPMDLDDPGSLTKRQREEYSHDRGLMVGGKNRCQEPFPLKPDDPTMATADPVDSPQREYSVEKVDQKDGKCAEENQVSNRPSMN